MIFSASEFGREFLSPHLHHVMDFPFPRHSDCHPYAGSRSVAAIDNTKEKRTINTNAIGTFWHIRPQALSVILDRSAASE